jgi:hypothetical protein
MSVDGVMSHKIQLFITTAVRTLLAVLSSETSVDFYRTIRPYILEDSEE